MTLRLRRVLWPTDFSELSSKAGRYARGLREVFGCEVHVIHVLPPPLVADVSVMIPAEVPLTVEDPGLLESAREGLKKLVKELFGESTGVVTEVLCGNPWMTICGYARRREIDLIVAATHGRTGLSHAFIGSTAERIVQHAPCPVLTVKQEQREFFVE